MGSAKTAIDWSKWDNPSLHREYLQKPRIDPENIVTLYGYPVTIESYNDSTIEGRVETKVRLALWMEGEAGRTKPLVEEHFDRDTFEELLYEARRKNEGRGGHQPPLSDFFIEWYHKNAGKIEKARFRRTGGSLAHLAAEDGNTPFNPKTRSFKGEDGRTYTEINLLDEDTDPVLLNATMNRDSILREQDARRIREQAAAAERRAREDEAKRLQEERSAREQAEFEAMPCWGAF